MTVRTAKRRHRFQPGSAMAAEAIPFPYLEPESLNVTLRVAGAIIPLVRDVDFALSGDGAAQAGTIQPLRPYAADAVIEVLRRTKIVQDTQIKPLQPFPATSAERSLDRQTMAAQEAADDVADIEGRAILLPEGEISASLPPAVMRRDTVLGFDPITGERTLLPTGSFPPGPPGGAGNVVKSIGQLRAALTSGAAMTAAYDGSGTSMVWTEGDFTALAAARPQDYIESDFAPLTVGAWVRQATAGIAHRAAGVGAIGRGLRDRIAEIEVSAADYGFSSTGSPADNLVAWKRAYAATPTGATLKIPRGADDAIVDTSGGRSAMLVIDRPIRLRVDGRVKASTTSPLGPNPSALIVVRAPGVTITGIGAFVGSGVIDDANAGNDETMPCLVFVDVTASDFRCQGISFVDPPKIGLHLYACVRASVACRFTGGPTAYGGDTATAHFGIRATGGGQHIISGCAFYPNAGGGMMVQCIFFSGVNDCVITNNTAKNPYEKFAYIFGDRHIVSKNSVQGNAAFIPGTRIQGTITLVIRTHGNDNTIEGNLTENCAGGAQVMGRGVADTGRGNAVINNKFLKCGQSAISVYQGVLTGTKVRGNTCTWGGLSGFVAGDGIRLAANAGSRRVDVSANDVASFSVADPLINIEPWQPRTYPKVAMVKPSTGNGRFYVQIGAGGPSGATEPVFPATPGATVVDGANIWVAVPFEGGQSEIKVIGAGPGPDALIESSISDNTTSGGRLGIVLSYVAYTTIARNQLSSTVAGMSESDTSFNRWENNVIHSGAATVQGRSATTAFITDPLMGSAPFDPPSVGAGQTTVATVSVPGADVGDHATAVWSGALEVVSCRVTAANVATVRLQNFSGAASDDAPSTLHVRVTKV